MDVEERQVYGEWNNDKPKDSRQEMLSNVFLQFKNINASKIGFNQFTIVWPFFMSRISHRSIKTAIPMVNTVRIPLTFDPQVQAINAPVAMSHVHHSAENSLENY